MKVTTSNTTDIVDYLLTDNNADKVNLCDGLFVFDAPIHIPTAHDVKKGSRSKPIRRQKNSTKQPATKKKSKPSKSAKPTKPKSPRKRGTTVKTKPVSRRSKSGTPTQSATATVACCHIPSPTSKLMDNTPTSLAYDVVELRPFCPFQPVPNPILKSPSLLSLATLPFDDLCSLGSLKDDFISIMEGKEEDVFYSPISTISVPNPLSIPTISACDDITLSTYPSIGTYGSEDLYICPLFPGPEPTLAFNSEFHPRHESTLPDNVTYCVACKCNCFDCAETKYGPYVVTQVECFFENKTCVSRRQIADKYFEIYNHLMNAIDKVEKGKNSVKFDRDPPICMFVNSYRRVLALSDSSDSDNDE